MRDETTFSTELILDMKRSPPQDDNLATRFSPGYQVIRSEVAQRFNRRRPCMSGSVSAGPPNLGTAGRGVGDSGMGNRPNQSLNGSVRVWPVAPRDLAADRHEKRGLIEFRTASPHTRCSLPGLENSRSTSTIDRRQASSGCPTQHPGQSKADSG
jgi:hypothetical protein